MRNHLRVLGSILLAATLCVTAVSFAQTNFEEYGNPINIPVDDSVDYTATGISTDDDDGVGSLLIYGGLLMLTLGCIGVLALAIKARRRPPQRIQL